jgi:hypothetical protein
MNTPACTPALLRSSDEHLPAAAPASQRADSRYRLACDRHPAPAASNDPSEPFPPRAVNRCRHLPLHRSGSQRDPLSRQHVHPEHTSPSCEMRGEGAALRLARRGGRAVLDRESATQPSAGVSSPPPRASRVSARSGATSCGRGVPFGVSEAADDGDRVAVCEPWWRVSRCGGAPRHAGG